jgi:catechol 2,3-dioxygenase-like lactoylglutathione lyase family enzyme
MQLEVVALDHLYVSVRDLARSEAFYDPVMKLLGFRKGTVPIGGDPHRHYFNRVMAYTLRPARSARPHDPYAPGLHHVCFRVADRQGVERAAAGLRDLGVDATPPALYPEYAEDYYATFFEDPDGIRLEVVAETRTRRLIRERWAELVEFENPLARSGLLEREP